MGGRPLFSLSLQVRETVLGQGGLVIPFLSGPLPAPAVLCSPGHLSLASPGTRFSGCMSSAGCFEGSLRGMDSARSLQSSAWEAMERASGLPSEGFGYRILGVSQAGLGLAEAQVTMHHVT